MAALVAGMVYLSVQMFNQGEIVQEVGAAPGMTGSCTPGSHSAAACQPVAASTHAPPTSPDPHAPFYVTVTVAE